MNCWLCGHESDSHHLGCARAAAPNLTKAQAIDLGLLAGPPPAKAKKPEVVEVLKEGSMTTEVVDSTCAFEGCDNPKYSDHPRVKFCEEHRDPKNRKE